MLLSLFIMLILYTIYSQNVPDISFLGTNIAIAITLLLFVLPYFQKKLSFFIFHWISFIFVFLVPTWTSVFVALWVFCFREFILKAKLGKNENTKKSVFFILSILQPIRNTKNVFLLSSIILGPTWVMNVLKHFNILYWDFSLLPLVLVSFCLSSQIAMDVRENVER